MDNNLNTWIDSELKPRVKSTVKPEIEFVKFEDWKNYISQEYIAQKLKNS
jgi:hypothetical protein